MFLKLIQSMARRCHVEILRGTQDPTLMELLSIYREFRLDHCTPLLRLDRSPQFAAQTSLRELIRHYQIDCVIDVGANRGQFGTSLRKLGYTGRIISFEPLPEARKELLERSRNDPDWLVRNCAVGAAQTMEPFHIFADDTFSSIHSINDDGHNRFGSMVEEVRSIEIEVLPLDFLAREPGFIIPGQRILLKTDTQGHDFEVLKGATRLLDSVSVVVTEASFQRIYKNSPEFADLAGLLKESGFQLSGVFPISHMATSFELIEADCHFVKPQQNLE